MPKLINIEHATKPNPPTFSFFLLPMPITTCGLKYDLDHTHYHSRHYKPVQKTFSTKHYN